MNTYRSAVSLLSTEKIGEDLLISRFFKGISKLRTPKPKYAFTWNVSIVLNYLRSLYPLCNLNLSHLTYKTVMLIALCTAHRTQTLANIRISNIKSTNTGLEIRIPELIKTSGCNRFQPLLLLPKYSQDQRLCVASTVIHYINVTKDLRLDDTLFIAIVKPHKAVGAQTISRWIKIILDESGIDTSIFTAHSTRHASTSCAATKGVDLNVIRSTAGWTGASEVFGRFYNRPILPQNSDFAASILNS